MQLSVYSHINNRRDVVETRDDDADLGDERRDEQRADRLPILRRHAEHVQERDDIVPRDGLQQPRST